MQQSTLYKSLLGKIQKYNSKGLIYEGQSPFQQSALQRYVFFPNKMYKHQSNFTQPQRKLFIQISQKFTFFNLISSFKTIKIHNLSLDINLY